MIMNRALLLLAAFLLNPLAASANVITDWDEKAVTLLQPRFVPPVAYRAMAIIELAMFEAVNSVDQRYQPYRTVLSVTPGTSQEAAAATAAAVAMSNLVPDAASDIQAALTTYLATLPDGSAKANGIKLGTEAAEAMLQARADAADCQSFAGALREAWGRRKHSKLELPRRFVTYFAPT